jgi:CheY-like chemotaxis protein
MRIHQHLPTILIVEDAQEHVELLEARFAEARLFNPIQTVPDGKLATEYLAGVGVFADRETYPLPGIVLLDLVLPLMDGFEVLTWIRAHPQFAKLPVIVLTAHHSDLLIERALNTGADGYLVKGVDTAGLIALLKNVNGGRKVWRVAAQ